MLKHVFVSNGSALWCVQRLLQNSYFNLQDLSLSATEKPNLKEKLRTVSLYLYREKNSKQTNKKVVPFTILHIAQICLVSHPKILHFSWDACYIQQKLGTMVRVQHLEGRRGRGGGGGGEVNKVYYGQRKNGKYHSKRI